MCPFVLFSMSWNDVSVNKTCTDATYIVIGEILVGLYVLHFKLFCSTVEFEQWGAFYLFIANFLIFTVVHTNI